MNSMAAILKNRERSYLLFLILSICCNAALVQKAPVDYVNVFTGTSNSRWMLFPGSTLPFGMIKLSPDNNNHNKLVKKVNRLVERYCLAHQVAYIDLNSMLSLNGELKNELTTDGTHLKEEAYSLCVKLFIEMLEKYKI